MSEKDDLVSEAMLHNHNMVMAAVDVLVGNRPVRAVTSAEEYAELSARLDALGGAA